MILDKAGIGLLMNYETKHTDKYIMILIPPFSMWVNVVLALIFFKRKLTVAYKNKQYIHLFEATD